MVARYTGKEMQSPRLRFGKTRLNLLMNLCRKMESVFVFVCIKNKTKALVYDDVCVWCMCVVVYECMLRSCSSSTFLHIIHTITHTQEGEMKISW